MKMKLNEFETWLKTLDEDLDKWSEIVEETHQYQPPEYFTSLNRRQLGYLKAKGLIDYEFKDGEMIDLYFTSAGVTYFEDKKREQLTWFIRDVIINVLITVITSILVTYLTMLLFKQTH